MIILPELGPQPTRSTPFVPGRHVPVQGDVRGAQTVRLGQAISNTGVAIMEVEAQMQNDEDEIAAKESYAAFADFVTRKLYGGPDPDAPDGPPVPGYLSLSGKSAVGQARSQVMSDIETRWQTQAAELGSPTRKGMFLDNVRRHMQGVRRQVYGHEAAERDKWREAQTDALRTQNLRDGVNSAVTPEVPDEIAAAAEAAGRAADVAAGRSPQGPTIGAPGETIDSRPADELQDPWAPLRPSEGLGSAIARAFEGVDMTAAFQAAPQGPPALPQGPQPERRPEWQVFLDSALEQDSQISADLGEGAEAAMVRKIETRTAFHTAVIGELLDQGRTKEARAWFEKHGDTMTPEGRAKVAGPMQRAVDQDIATDAAREVTAVETEPGSTTEPEEYGPWPLELLAQSKPGIITENSPASALNRANERLKQMDLTPDQRAMALAQIKSDLKIRENAYLEENRNMLLEVERIFEAVRSQGGIPDVSLLPPQLQQRLFLRGHLDSARDLANQRQTSGHWYDLMMKEATGGGPGGRPVFHGKNEAWLYNRYGTKLSQRDYDRARSYLLQANGGGSGGTKDDRWFKHKDRILGRIWDPDGKKVISGVNERGEPVSDGAREGGNLHKFWEVFQDRVNAEEQLTGKPPDINKLLEIADELVGQQEEHEGDISDDTYFTWNRPATVSRGWLAEAVTLGFIGERKATPEDFIIETSTGQKVTMAKIPADALNDMQDAVRLDAIEARSLTEHAEAEARYDDLKKKGDRTAIEKMFDEYGVVDIDLTQNEKAEMWVTYMDTRGSEWFKHEDPDFQARKLNAARRHDARFFAIQLEALQQFRDLQQAFDEGLTYFSERPKIGDFNTTHSLAPPGPFSVGPAIHLSGSQPTTSEFFDKPFPPISEIAKREAEIREKLAEAQAKVR